MRFAFRVDASVQIGTGHIMRCLTLADHLASRGGRCDFVMRRHAGHCIDAVRARGHAVSELPPAPDDVTVEDGPAHAAWLGVHWTTDAEQTRQALGAEGYDWLVIDHYALDARWEVAVGPVARRCLVLDDLADRTHHCHLLVDQNLQSGPSRYDGLVPDGTPTLLGPRFALLRPAFGTHRATLQRDALQPVRRLLVFLGGIDAPGLTQPVLEAIASVRQDDQRVSVVVGQANPRRQSIVDWCSSHAWATVHDGDADMAALMAECDLAIGAGGTTMWERAALAMPSIIVAIAENQKPGSEAMARYGAAIYLGDDRAVAHLAAALQTLLTNPWLRQHLSDRSASLVDARGTARVANHLLDDAVTLRPASPADCDIIWTWRNDERTRRHFHDPRPVDLEAHRRWFAASLDAEARDLLIGLDADEAVGVLRFDHEGDRAIVSIYLVPGRSGRGDGARLLRAGLRWLTSHRPATRRVDAEVLKANDPSQHAFEAAGFMPHTLTYRHSLPTSEAAAQ